MEEFVVGFLEMIILVCVGAFVTGWVMLEVKKGIMKLVRGWQEDLFKLL